MPQRKIQLIGEPDIVSLGTKQIYEKNRRYKYFDENNQPKKVFIEWIFERMSELFDEKYKEIVLYLQSTKGNGFDTLTDRTIIARAMVAAAKDLAPTHAFKIFFEKYFDTSEYVYMLAHCNKIVFRGDVSQQFKTYRKYFSSLIFEMHHRESEYVKRLDDFSKIERKYKLVVWRTSTGKKEYLYIHKRLFREANKLCKFLEGYTGVTKEDIFSNACTVTVTQCRGVILMYFEKKYPQLPNGVLASFVYRGRKHMKRWRALYKRYTTIMSKTDEARRFFELYRNITLDMG